MIKENYFGACLPSTLLFCDEAGKLGYQPKMLLGFIRHNRLRIPIMHFWAKVENEYYDPTRKVIKHFHNVNESDFTYEEFDVWPMNEEQILMKMWHKKYIQSQSSANYFEEAPETLLRIRKSIKRRVNSLLLNRNNNL